jgi:hypothetical protein
MRAKGAPPAEEPGRSQTRPDGGPFADGPRYPDLDPSGRSGPIFKTARERRGSGSSRPSTGHYAGGMAKHRIVAERSECRRLLAVGPKPG